MSERRDERVISVTGDIVILTNGGLTPIAVTVDCGEYGTIMFDVAGGGEARLKVGTEAPTFFVNDVETDIPYGENVVPIRDPD